MFAEVYGQEEYARFTGDRQVTVAGEVSPSSVARKPVAVAGNEPVEEIADGYGDYPETLEELPCAAEIPNYSQHRRGADKMAVILYVNDRVKLLCGQTGSTEHTPPLLRLQSHKPEAFPPVPPADEPYLAVAQGAFAVI